MDSTPQPAISPIASLERAVRKGMAYADFRSEAMAQGWTPVVDPECRANVVGADHAAVCAANPDLCRVCEDIPELSAYSGDAHSLSVFHNAAHGLRLEVTGLGELRDWNVPGEDSGLQIVSWEITPENASSNP